MYVKFMNLSTNQPFVVSDRSFDHYKDNPKVKYLGTCDEVGNIITAAEDDEVYQARTLKEQLAEVEKNLKKKAVAESRTSDNDSLTTDVDDEE